MFLTSSRSVCTRRAFAGGCLAQIHSICVGLSYLETPVRLAYSRQSIQRAWLAGTGAQGDSCDMHTRAKPCQQALRVRFYHVLQPTLCTASEAPDPGLFYQLRVSGQQKADRSGAGNDERYMHGIFMVYAW